MSSQKKNKKAFLIIGVAFCGFVLVFSYIHLKRSLENTPLKVEEQGSQASEEQRREDTGEAVTTAKSLLKVRVVKIIRPDTLEVQPLQAQEGLAPGKQERLWLKGVTVIPIGNRQGREKLFAHFQEDFCRAQLQDAQVSVDLERLPQGGFRRGNDGELQGYVFLSSGEMYQMLALERGIMKADISHVENQGYKKLFHEVQEWAQRDKRGLFGYPQPAISLTGLARHSGEIITLRFQVFRMINDNDLNVLLNIDALVNNTFSVVVPRDYLGNFTTGNSRSFFKGYEKQWVRVNGYLAENSGKFHIRIYDPAQLLLE